MASLWPGSPRPHRVARGGVAGRSRVLALPDDARERRVEVSKLGVPTAGEYIPLTPYITLYEWFAYTPLFSGGVSVSCTIRQDGVVYLITAAGPGGGPHVADWVLP